MTNDNNNINELVSTSDDDPTEELEIPKILSSDLHESLREEAYDVVEEADEDAVAVLRSNLMSSNELVEKLQDDVAARLEEIADGARAERRLRDELDALRAEFATALDDLDSSRAAVTALQEELSERVIDAAESSEATEKARRAAKQDRTRIRELEKDLKNRERIISDLESRVAEMPSADDSDIPVLDPRLLELEGQLRDSHSELATLRNSVDDSQSSLSRQKDELAEALTNLEAAKLHSGELSARVEELDGELDARNTELEALAARLADRDAECDRLSAENREFRNAAAQLDDSEFEKNRMLIAEQSGRLSTLGQEVRTLEGRVSGSEQYADDLRRKLQAQLERAEQATSDNAGLKSALDAAKAHISDLAQSQQQATDRGDELAALLDQTETVSTKEIDDLKGEVEAAQKIIAEQSAVNEQILSDLADQKGYRQALEIQLSETEEKFERKVRHLEKKSNRLRNQADDYERKLKNKDNAIAALMNELANRSAKIEAIEEIEQVIQEIDERKGAAPGGEAPIDRERVTRLLIGKMDGQELRFPLFKNRLTIGRTAHNDIQLNAQFVSRRHAVIVTEPGGTRIVDWGSRNGVFINEKRVAEQVLKNGDIVTIGTTDFRYEERAKR